MTAQQAKQVLIVYRPWVDDTPDSEVVEAIALCQQDGELRIWFEKHCAAQSAIRDCLRKVPVPEGLQQQIVSEFKSNTSVAWWRRPAVLAPVAATVLIIAIASIWFNIPRQPSQDVSFATYRNRMVRNLDRTYGMDFETNDVAQIRAYLAQHQSPADYDLPKNLAQTPQVGCGALSWQGKPVAMVCFRTGKPLSPGAKSDLFLFVIDQKDLLNPPETGTPIFANVGTMTTATWRADGKVYLLAGPDAAELKQRL